MQVGLTEQEWYPVLVVTRMPVNYQWHEALVFDLPDELVERFEAALTEFKAASNAIVKHTGFSAPFQT